MLLFGEFLAKEAEENSSGIVSENIPVWPAEQSSVETEGPDHRRLQCETWTLQKRQNRRERKDAANHTCPQQCGRPVGNEGTVRPPGPVGQRRFGHNSLNAVLKTRKLD